MTAKSPTNLTTPRNMALQKGTVSNGFVEPDLQGMQPILNEDEAQANRTTAGTPSPAIKPPFKARGA